MKIFFRWEFFIGFRNILWVLFSYRIIVSEGILRDMRYFSDFSD